MASSKSKVLAGAAVALCLLLHLGWPRYSVVDDAGQSLAPAAARHAWLAHVPPPPPLDLAALKARHGHGPTPLSSATQDVARTRPKLVELVYDPNLSLTENLLRLKNYCAKDPHRESLTFRTASFAAALARLASKEASLIRAALDDQTAPSFFRVLMLQCLVKIRGPGYEESVWHYALDASQGELSTAGALFLRELDSSKARPDDYLRVLEGAEGDRAIFALQAARAHVNERVLAKIEEMIAKHGDLNVRVAAVHAAGDAGAIAQTYLLSLAGTPAAAGTTSKDDDDLVRRSAIWRLDPSWPATASVVRQLAADPNESPGVRRKAVVKFAETAASSAESFIIDLMNTLPDDQAIVLTGCAEALMQLGTPSARLALAQRSAAIADESLKGAFDHVLHPSN